MKISDLTIYKTKALALPLPTLRNQLREIDDAMQAIKNKRKEQRVEWYKLTARRAVVIANMPEGMRPKRGRPAREKVVDSL